MALTDVNAPVMFSDGNVSVNKSEVAPSEWNAGNVASEMEVSAFGKGSGRITIQIKESGKPTKTYSIKLAKDAQRSVTFNTQPVSGGAGELSVTENPNSIAILYAHDTDSSALTIDTDVNGNLDSASILSTISGGDGPHSIAGSMPGKGHLSSNVDYVGS